MGVRQTVLLGSVLAALPSVTSYPPLLLRRRLTRAPCYGTETWAATVRAAQGFPTPLTPAHETSNIAHRALPGGRGLEGRPYPEDPHRTQGRNKRKTLLSPVPEILGLFQHRSLSNTGLDNILKSFYLSCSKSFSGARLPLQQRLKAFK